MSSSDGFLLVCRFAEIPDGTMKCVAVDGERVLIAQVAGRLYALSDKCGHKNAPLSRGRLLGQLVECPLHFARFDLGTGRLVDGPVSADLPIYEVRVEAGIVFVRR